MTVSVRRVELVPSGLSVANAQARLQEIGGAIVGMGVGWTVTQDAVVYDTNYVAHILSHTSGAQLCIHAANTSGTAVNAANSYGGGNINNYYTAFSFKPSQSGASFATVDDTTNPKDTATFCSDAGAFNFMAWAAGAGTFQFDDYNASIVAVADTTYANLWIILLDDGYTPYQLFSFADDAPSAPNFVGLVGADAEKAFQLLLNISTDIDSLIWGTTYATSKLSFIDAAGSDLDSATITADTASLSRLYSSTDPETGNGTNNGKHRREYITMIKPFASYPQGVKGIIDPSVYSIIRSDAMPNQVFGSGTDWQLHITNGHCIPWPRSYGALR